MSPRKVVIFSPMCRATAIAWCSLTCGMNGKVIVAFFAFTWMCGSPNIVFCLSGFSTTSYPQILAAAVSVTSICLLWMSFISDLAHVGGTDQLYITAFV